MSTLGSRHASHAAGSDSPIKPLIHKGREATVKPTRDLNHLDLRLDMHGKVMIIDHDTFMNNFVPLPSDDTSRRLKRKIFADMPIPTDEQEMYSEIPVRMNAVKRILCPGFHVLATPHKPDSNTPEVKLRPDAGLYRKNVNKPESASDRPQYGRTDWANIDIPLECKSNLLDDPFDDRAPDGQGDSLRRKKTFGQILSYCELVLQKQQRTSTFLVIFIGPFARLVWVDRSGMFATHRFNYINAEEKLTEFLWRYSKMTPAQRGYDGSVERISPISQTGLAKQLRARLAKEVEERPNHYITKFFGDSLKDKHAWWKIKVFDEETGQECLFAAAKPNFTAPGVRGRGTRGYVAISIDEHDQLGEEFVYLKDAWRVNLPGIRKEGATLKKLNDAEVPYVPTLVCHGDIPGQVTRSPHVWRKLHPGRENECPLKDHQHYRMVVKEIGQPLSEFENSYQLLKVLLSCLIAHEAACRLGIVHRDISSGNILLVQHGEFVSGYLMDWELAKDESEEDSVARQHERTGTWQFMSAHVQNDPTRVVVIPDELESLLHVLIFFAVRFLSHNLPDHQVGRFLYEYFDGYSPDPRGQRVGPMKISAIEKGSISLRTFNGDKKGDEIKLRFIHPSSTTAQSCPDLNHPLNKVIDTLFSWFQALYALDEQSTSGQSAVNNGRSPVPTKTAVDNDPLFSLARKRVPNKASPSSQSDVPAKTASTAPLADPSILAKKTYTHLPMMELLLEQVSLPEWVAIMDVKERTKDKRPKRGHVPEQQRQPYSYSGVPFQVLRSEPSELPAKVSGCNEAPVEEDEDVWESGAEEDTQDAESDSNSAQEEEVHEGGIYGHLTGFESPEQRSFVQSFAESLGKRKQYPEAESPTSKRSKH